MLVLMMLVEAGATTNSIPLGEGAQVTRIAGLYGFRSSTATFPLVTLGLMRCALSWPEALVSDLAEVT